jgi:hypothetical protein
MAKFFHWMNENHWYIIATIIICAFILWLFGCQSQVKSMVYPERMVNRSELKAESDYLIATIQSRVENLDDQDAIKRLILEQATIFGTTGTFNPLGLLNTIVSIGAISFGLNRNQKVNALKTQLNAGTSG